MTAWLRRSAYLPAGDIPLNVSFCRPIVVCARYRLPFESVAIWCPPFFRPAGLIDPRIVESPFDRRRRCHRRCRHRETADRGPATMRRFGRT